MSTNVTIILQNITSTIAQFKPINFKIEYGTIVRICGPNGIGKTTLLKILTGLSNNYSGNITLNDQKISDIEMNFDLDLKVQAIFSDALYERMSLKRNIQIFSKRWSGCDLSDAAMKFFKIEQYWNKLVAELSCGTRRKIALSRLIACPAKIWIIDEADIYLDNESLDILSGLLKNHTNYGGMIIFTSHSDKLDNILDQKVLLSKQ